MDVTEDLVKELVSKNFPNQEIKNIARITKGYSHYMFDVSFEDRNVILRISKNKKENVCIEKELFVMKKYAEIGIPVPEVLAHDTTHSLYPFDFLIMSKVSGTCVQEIWDSLEEGDKSLIAFEIGRLLSKIHTISVEGFGDIGPNGVIEDQEFSFRSNGKEPEHSVGVRKLLQDGMKYMSGLIAYKMLNAEQSAQLISYLHNQIHLIEDAQPVLAHVDILLDHIFVEKKNDNWEITGLIDFEFAAGVAPEFDFIKLHRQGLLEGGHVKDALLQGYGDVHERFDDIVLLYRVVRDLGFCRYVSKAGNVTVAQEALNKVFTLIK